MRSIRVPSSATSVASVLADSCTSPAANAGRETQRASPIALPILVDVTSLPQVGLPLREPPDLQILLARAQRVQQALRLAPVHRLLRARPRVWPRLRLLLLARRRPILPRRILLVRLLLLLSLRLLLRRRRPLLVVRLALLRFRLLVALLRGLVLLRLSRRAAPVPFLGAQQQLQVHLGVRVVRIQGERCSVLADRIVRLPQRLQRQRHLVCRL